MTTIIPKFVDWTKNLALIPYCLVVGAISFVGAYAISASAEIFGINLETQLAEYSSTLDLSNSGVMFISFIGPIVETLFLCAFLSLLLKSKLSKHQCCVLSALVWGLLHGLLAPIKFFTATWTFYFFSIGYVLWKQKSITKGFIAAALPHIILNLIGIIIILFT